METWPHKKWNPFCQLDIHEGIFPLVPTPMFGFAAHMAGGVLASPWGGGFFGENKNSKDKVLADGMPIVSRAHEPKVAIIPHWNVFPIPAGLPNFFIPFLVLGSSSKCEFAVGSVQAEDGAVAVSIDKWHGLNLACNDPCSLPTSETYNWGTVILGMTKGDIVAGLLFFAFDGLKSFVEGQLLGPIFEKLVPKGLLKGQISRFLNWRNIPTSYLDEVGNLADLPDELAGQPAAIFEFFYGKVVGGSTGDSTVNKTPIGKFLSGDAIAGKDGYIEDLGAWIDGRAEYLPTSPEPPAEPQLSPSTASPAPTPAPTPNPVPDTGPGAPTGGPTATPTGAPIAPPAQAAPVALPAPSAPVAPPPPAPGPLMPTPTPVAAPANAPTPTDVPSPTPAPPVIPSSPPATPIMTPTPTPPPTGTPKPDK